MEKGSVHSCLKEKLRLHLFLSAVSVLQKSGFHHGTKYLLHILVCTTHLTYAQSMLNTDVFLLNSMDTGSDSYIRLIPGRSSAQSWPNCVPAGTRENMHQQLSLRGSYCGQCYLISLLVTKMKESSEPSAN